MFKSSFELETIQDKLAQSQGELEVLNRIMNKFGQPNGDIYIPFSDWKDFNKFYHNKATKLLHESGTER